MNITQAHRKARTAVKKREDLLEEEEVAGGEINLIPYLDIVTNLMLFLLASVASGILLGQINTTLPDKAPSNKAGASSNPNKDPNDQPLQLVVSVFKDRIDVWSISGLEGTLQKPKASIAKTGDTTSRGKKIPVFDFKKLNNTLEEIATRRWQGKQRVADTYQIILMADGAIPYGAIIPTMDALRCKAPTTEGDAGVCALPKVAAGKDGTPLKAEQLTGGKGLENKPCLPNGACLDGFVCSRPKAPPSKSKDDKKPKPAPTCRAYDAASQALFHDILFSPGFD